MAFRNAGLKVSPWALMVSGTQRLPSRRSTPFKLDCRKWVMRPVSALRYFASSGSEASLLTFLNG
ncbi:hypothetical protein D3C86_1931590 [compost metagenome]